MRDPRFVGAWDLVESVRIAADGQRSPGRWAGFPGQLIYSADGRMFAAATDPDRPGLPAGSVEEYMALLAAADDQAVELRASLFDALTMYWGEWTADAARSEVVHEVLGAHVPNLVGTEQRRQFRFEGDTLALRTPLDADGACEELVWRRVRAR